MFNQHKAGLESVDKEAVNKVIEDASQGTAFWENQQRKEARHQERIRKVLERLNSATEQDSAKAQTMADEYLKQLEQPETQRIVVHIDMDAFFASVEERDNPTLKEKPMAVGCHSMLSTSNYAARRFGVRAGLPGFIALKLCPQLVLVPPDMRKYAEASEKVMEILSRYDSNLIVYGLDEAVLDISEICNTSEKTVEEIVSEIRQEVKNATNLTCSAGIGPNRLVAKILADVNKPDGQFRLQTVAEIESFFQELSVRKIPGIGQVQEKILKTLHCEKCSDFIKHRAVLYLVFSEAAANFYLAAAKGICNEALESSDSAARSRRSKSAETTFKDSDKLEFLQEVCQHLSERLAEDLQLGSLRGKLITVKFKTSSFDVFSRSVALEVATNSQATIANQSIRILKNVVNQQAGVKFRLLGVRMSNFQDAESKRQATLSQLFQPAAESNEEPELRVPESPLKPGPSGSSERKVSFADGEKLTENFEVTEDVPEVKAEEKTNVIVAKEKNSEVVDLDTLKDLIEETYCPICAVIMRNVPGTEVNRHINKCIDREKEREKLMQNKFPKSNASHVKSKGIKKRTTASSNSKKKPVQSIKNFFSE